MHDLVGLHLVVNLQSQELGWSSELELGGVGLLVLLDGDSVSRWKVLHVSSHDLDEFLQVLNFLWLYAHAISKSMQKPTILILRLIYK